MMKRRNMVGKIKKSKNNKIILMNLSPLAFSALMSV
jgi:hypothetical protein